MNKKELKKAFEEKLITEDQFKDAIYKLEIAPKEKKRKVIPVEVTFEEFSAIIKNTKNINHKIAFLLGFGSGLRISEVLGLKQEDINLKDKKIIIRQGKGSKDRIVPLPKGFKDNMLQNIPLKYKSSRALQRAFKRSCKKAKILDTKPTIHFHSLRHGFTTRLLNNGVPIQQVSMLLGHANISTTNIYAGRNIKDALKYYEDLF